MSWAIGVDLGQRRDPSAIVAVERVGETLRVRHVEKLPLGTSWAAVVKRVAVVAEQVPWGAGRMVVADATGVGAPVVEMLRKTGVPVAGVVWTGGTAEGRSGGSRTVPKQQALALMRVALERGALRIARAMVGREALVEEMEKFGSGEGHDDLVMALALGVWWLSSRGEIGEQGGWIPCA